ncbi:MAG: DUF5668 domain-containing protein [Bacteroidetes bacterium]|nr:DUF5668 domain-containing protein [Bacteroidota bacterium]
MKISRLFAGILITLLGIALILTNFDIVSLNWHFIFKLWPILLIFGGISMLVSDSKWRGILFAVTSVLVLVWIFSLASIGWGNFRGIFHHDGRFTHNQEFTQDMSKDVRHAVLTLNAGAGYFSINDTSSELFYAHTESNVGDYALDANKDGSTERLDFTLKSREDHWSFGGSKNHVEMMLNPKPDWNLNVDVGACSVNFDLTPFIIRTAEIKAGASSLRIRLGDKSDTTHLSMDTGASSVVVYVPESAGCQINDRAELSSKTFDNFMKDSDGIYHTPNFDSAKKKVFIDIKAGVSSIKVKRY